MGIDSLLRVLEDLVLKSVSEIEDDLISISFDSISEEVDLELDIRLLKILKGQSELSAENEHFDSLGWEKELSMSVQEFNDVSMWEDDLSITIQIGSLVHDQYRNEVNQKHDCVLILVDLTSFNFDEFVRHILFNMKHDLILQHVLDHLIILSFQKLENIISRNIEVRIIGYGQFEFKIFSKLSDEPSIMDELSSFNELRVHDQRHEVVLVDHSVEGGFHESLLGILSQIDFLFILLLLLFLALSLLTLQRPQEVPQQRD